MKSITQLLNTIKQRHDLKSDYKLALYLGIGESALANYRHERTLPDAAACVKIAAALDIDPDLLTVQIEAMRAKTDDARRLWERVAQRLQMGFANCALLAIVAIFSIAACALPAWSAIGLASSSANSLYIMLSRFIRVIYARTTHRAAIV